MTEENYGEIFGVESPENGQEAPTGEEQRAPDPGEMSLEGTEPEEFDPEEEEQAKPGEEPRETTRRRAGEEPQRILPEPPTPQTIAFLQDMAIRKRIDGQMREIEKLTPSLRRVEDLRRLPEYPRLCALVEKGYELSDAYKVACFGELTQRAAGAIRQAAMNRISGKNHMTQTWGRGAGGVTVPYDIREQYRLLNPEATEEEIQRHYNRCMK